MRSLSSRSGRWSKGHLTQTQSFFAVTQRSSRRLSSLWTLRVARSNLTDFASSPLEGARSCFTLRSTIQFSAEPVVQLVVGQERLELSTPRLSSVCSNQLSYWPASIGHSRPNSKLCGLTSQAVEDCEIDRNRLNTRFKQDSRKEVIQPQVPLRLPCYDFTPVTSHSLGGYLTRLAHRLLEQLTPMV